MRKKIRYTKKKVENDVKLRKRQKIYLDKLEKKYTIIEEELNKLEEKCNVVELELEENKLHKGKKYNFNKKGIFKFIVIFVFLIFLFFIISFPRITFKNKTVKVRYNTDFVDKDYKAKSLLKNYTKMVKVVNKVNTKEIGVYKIKYKLKFGLFTISKIKNVEVIDDVKPAITLTGSETSVICPGKEYKEIGYEAFDEYDGNLTEKVVIENKKDEIIYKVSDSSGNADMILRKIVYEDKEKPKIELKGSNNINIYVGNSYNEPGYSALDNCDGDITSKVEVSGSVNTNVAGTYNITYKVKDSNKNEVAVTRVVNVKNWSVIRPSAGGNGQGIVYLTFDDGPNEGTTNIILDVLKEEGVPATFFVTCNGPDYLIKRMYNEGHTVALHTATHNYNYVYSSVDNYFQDLNRVSNRVKNLTGIDSKIIRFPGGSSNTISKRLSPGIMTTLTSEVRRRGYKYFDWNVDSNDAAGAGTNAVYSNVVNNISAFRENVVLMHDVKTATRDAIRNIIRYGKSNGYTFRKITDATVMVTHGVNN